MPKERYDRASYHRAVQRGCEKAFNMPKEFKRRPGDAPDVAKERTANREAWHAAHGWHPHQLRHAFATRLEATCGIGVAQLVLGHSSPKVTQAYVEANVAKAFQTFENAGRTAE